MDNLVSFLLDQTKTNISYDHQTEGYRNKITYTLGSLFSISPLAPTELNEICSSVQIFRSQLEILHSPGKKRTEVKRNVKTRKNKR